MNYGLIVVVKSVFSTSDQCNAVKSSLNQNILDLNYFRQKII